MHISASSYTAQRIPGVLHAVIIASAFWALSLSLTIGGSVSAVVGCLIACLLTDRWINASPLDQIRLSSVVADGSVFYRVDLLAGRSDCKVCIDVFSADADRRI